MRIEQLQAFLAVAQQGSFGQAARLCGITQSTISRQIQALESELGLALLHRTSQTKLTLAGEQLFPRAKRICQEWENALGELTELREGKQPELCVAAIHSVCAYHLPPVLLEFCRQYPQVQLRVTALGSDRAIKVLRDSLVDVAIVMNNPLLTTSPEIMVAPLYEEPVEVLMAAGHPLAAYSEVPWSELVHYPQVVFKDGYGMQRLVQERFNKLGATLQAAMELNTLDAFRGVVRQGKMIALLPQSALQESKQDPSLAVRSLGNSSVLVACPPLTRQVVLVTTRDRLEIPPIQHFCNLVKQMLTVSPESRESVPLLAE
ncbi:LysR family transcriptional regulator [Spirulina subsalsa FACHB-351]|uniref:LysR family transcriptional regulator n=1 Tax=Spirulina subsalsa FACHB-351 TaxID=234711 RepID=A0ABT3L540_9CYAN|nr:LysR family transcriptional regulator [Spirulina subsalsa]MCW6036600.1 LysR family transcriptional regulator [Spirulina subsalsa FACHB-351]